MYNSTINYYKNNMNNIFSYLLANTYSGFSPLTNNLASVCKVNGQVVECPQFLSILAPLAVSFVLLSAIIGIITIIGTWKVYTKAGKPGWTSIIPIYNMVVLLEIVGRPLWWVILGFIPVVNIVVGVIVLNDLSKAFGKDVGFTIGLLFLPFVFYPILGFGKAQYKQTPSPVLTQ